MSLQKAPEESSDYKMFRVLEGVTKNIFAYRMLDKSRAMRIISNSTSAKSAIQDINNPQGLPLLPVPPLEKTLDKYLRTVKPHLSNEEYTKTSDLVKNFGAPGGVGEKLQSLLNKHAAKTDSWLANWWLHSAYLEFRWPVVVHSSPGLVFPERKFASLEDRLQFSAKLINAAMDYKSLIDKKQIPLDKMGKYPLDMAQYQKIFGTCRIPGLKRDSLSFNPSSKHIIVLHNNHLFKVPVYGNNSELLSESQILEQLKCVLDSSKDRTVPVGVLTTEHRDTWGKAYNLLIQDPVNRSSLSEIEKALFVVSIDGNMPNKDDINRQTTAGKQFIHGGGSAANAGNRWYDKTIQFIVGEDGLNGLTYEHSPAEGQPIAVLTDHVVNYIEQNKGAAIHQAPSFEKPTKLSFNVSDETQKYIQEANKNIDALVDDLEMNCFTFKAFGKDFIKSQKLSPDSFIQMAQQFAFYRIHKIPGAHYESAATRMYLHGRTETIRSCSNESIHFAKTMLNPVASDNEKVQALKAAIQGHKEYTVQALSGFGVDRHLLGLKLIAIENGIEVPKLYQDAGYAKSAHMRISTSQVASRCDGFMCYGPLVANGYACCYNPRDKDMNFGISAFKSNPETSADRFRVALEDSLYDMHDLLLRATLKSKL